jgi:hypothetical protein
MPMQRLFFALLLLVSASAVAAPLADKDKAALGGEWRVLAAGESCAAKPDKTMPRFTLEFAITGGQIFIDDPRVTRLMIGVHSTDSDGDALTLSFLTRSSWAFRRTDKDTLVSQTPPNGFDGLKGLIFHLCRPPADRSALKLEHDAVDFFSVMMPPDYPTFIDAHEKDGCKAARYDFVSIDLVGPEEFAITRGSLRPATKTAPPQLVGESVWSIDAAEELPNVVRLTITPLTGPDRVRGTPTKISLVAGEEASLLTIPEWDAVYRRCTIRELGPN